MLNPRSLNKTHTIQNIDIFDFEINEENMLDLASIPVSKVSGHVIYI